MNISIPTWGHFWPQHRLLQSVFALWKSCYTKRKNTKKWRKHQWIYLLTSFVEYVHDMELFVIAKLGRGVPINMHEQLWPNDLCTAQNEPFFKPVDISKVATYGT